MEREGEGVEKEEEEERKGRWWRSGKKRWVWKRPLRGCEFLSPASRTEPGGAAVAAAAGAMVLSVRATTGVVKGGVTAVMPLRCTVGTWRCPQRGWGKGGGRGQGKGGRGKGLPRERRRSDEILGRESRRPGG